MLFRECSNFDGQIGHFSTETLQGKANNILLLCLDSKMTCKAQESNQNHCSVLAVSSFECCCEQERGN